MKGAIIGDIVGSRFERQGIKLKEEEFELFTLGNRITDDSILTVATAEVLLARALTYESAYKFYAQKYAGSGFGGQFTKWATTPDSKPYNSFGNGSAMRVSPIAYAFESLDEVLSEAAASACVTHNHIEGIKGAQATAAAVFLARKGSTKLEIKNFIQETFYYNLDRTLAEIRPNYSFDVTCQGSVPESIICFLEGNSYEDVIRKAASLGGDTDTMAAIAGSIAEASFCIPSHLRRLGMSYAPPEFQIVVDKFYKKFNVLESGE